jgi:hypothetical protein
MIITLKRNKALTPIIFNTEYWSENNVIHLKESNNTGSCFTTDEAYSIYMNKDLIKIYQCYKVPPRSGYISIYKRFYGGLCLEGNRLIVLIVINPLKEEFCIVEKEFSEQYPSYLAKIKKSINMLGIPSRSRLVLATRDEIFTNFQQTIVPDMNDFMDEAKLVISTEFLNKFKNG